MPLISPKALQSGFTFALLASIVIMLGAVIYLFVCMLTMRPSAAYGGVAYGSSAELLSHYALTSTAFAGTAFLFAISISLLGSALLIAGIEGDIEGEGAAQNITLKFARISPGALAIVCATIIISVCLIARPKLDLQNQWAGAPANDPVEPMKAPEKF
jgi:hypothetical protein